MNVRGIAVFTFSAVFLTTPGFVNGGEIHEAVAKGDLERVKVLVKDNPKLVNAEDDRHIKHTSYEIDFRGMTPLHFAANGMRGSKDLAELLLAKGAKVDAKDIRGMTPLHYAANRGHAEIAALHAEHPKQCAQNVFSFRNPRHRFHMEWMHGKA